MSALMTSHSAESRIVHPNIVSGGHTVSHSIAYSDDIFLFQIESICHWQWPTEMVTSTKLRILLPELK
jgi:hypothetical protein